MIDAMTNLRLEVETAPPAGKTKNLFKNPDGSLGGFMWATPNAGTVDTSPTLAGFVRYTHATGGTGFWTERMPVVVGEYVSAKWKMSSTGLVTITATIMFIDANGNITSSGASPSYGSAPTTERTFGPILVPSGAVAARLTVIPGGAIVAGDVIEFAEVGFVCRSSSSAVVWANDVVMTGATWLNVLGPAIEIEVQREALDLGTLSATIRDATLDPLTATTIRPGRECRLTALHGTTGTWEPVFKGEITEFEVEYEADVLARKPGDPKHCRIEISATDATRTLASVSRPEGVSLLGDLRDTLEDVGVPWSINGNTGHTGTPPTIVSTNENASALDQVALTRDSRSAHAWLDRRGILQVWDRAKLLPFTNPSAETDATGWTTAAMTLTRVTTPTYTPPGAFQAVSASSALMTMSTQAQPQRVVPGHHYSVSVKVRAAAANRNVRLDLVWRDANGTIVGTTTGVATTTTTGAWTTHTVTCLPSAIPTLARTVSVTVTFLAGAGVETFQVDDLQGLNAEVVLDQSVWSGIKIGGGSRQCINEVTIDHLLYTPAAGTEPAKTETVTYGPYRNEASIGVYGVRARKFTIHGALPFLDIPAYAATVLAANAFPKVAASEVTLPIKSAGDLTMTKALGDLQQIARVSFATKGYSEALRITSVRHLIRSDAKYKARWIVQYGFEATSTVAAPRTIPSPPGGGQSRLALTDTDWVGVTFQNGWANYGAPWETAAYRRINGIVYLRGLVRNPAARPAQDTMFNLPAGFRPNSDTHILVAFNGIYSIVNIYANGDVKTNGAPGAGQWYTLRPISFPADQ